MSLSGQKSIQNTTLVVNLMHLVVDFAGKKARVIVFT